MSNLLTSKYLKEGLGDLLSKPRKVSLQIPTNPKTQQMISLAIDKGIDPETIRRSIGQSNAIPKGEQRFKDWGGIGKVLDVFSRAGENALWQLDEHVVNIVSITHEALQPRTKEEKQLYNYNYYKKVYGEEAAKKYKESGYTKLGAFESLEKEADSETVEKIKKSLSDFAVTKVYNTFEREQLNQFFNDKQMEVAKPLFDADPKLSNWKEYLYTATSGGLSLLEAVGLTLVTGSPTLGAGFLSSIEATESYDNARKAGLMPAEARDVFVLTGGGTFILESFGLEFITNKMVSSRLLHAFLSTGVETVQEELQTVWQNLIERHTYNESKDIFGEWWETAVGIAPSAFVAGFFMPGGSSQQGIRLSQDIAKRANIDRVLADRVVQSMIKSGSVIKDSVFKSLKTPGLTIEDVSKRLEPLAKEATKVFDTKTGLPTYDAMLKTGKMPGRTMTYAEYFAEEKGKVANIVYMSPDEYLSKIVKAEPTKSSIDYMKAQLTKGDKLGMPSLDYTDTPLSQEGRNRAYLAKELGLKQIPVLEIKPYQATKGVEKIYHGSAWLEDIKKMDITKSGHGSFSFTESKELANEFAMKNKGNLFVIDKSKLKLKKLESWENLKDIKGYNPVNDYMDADARKEFLKTGYDGVIFPNMEADDVVADEIRIFRNIKPSEIIEKKPIVQTTKLESDEIFKKALRDVESLYNKKLKEGKVSDVIQREDRGRKLARIADKYTKELPSDTRDFLMRQSVKDLETGEIVHGYDRISGGIIKQLDDYVYGLPTEEATKPVKEVKEIESIEEIPGAEKEITTKAQEEIMKQEVLIEPDRIDKIVFGKEKMKEPSEKSDWSEPLGKFYNKIFSKDRFLQGPDEVADDLGITVNELQTEIEKRILVSEEQIKVTDEVRKEIKEIKASKEMESLSVEMKKKVRTVFRPSKKKSSRSFALLGNKDTSIPLFAEVFDNWARDGVDTLIEPYGGAFTLGTHSLDNAINSGLKDFHSNIFDKEKYIIINHIQKNGVLEVEQSVDRAVARLNNKIQERAKGSLAKPINEFLKENPGEYIGSKEWRRWIKNEQVGKDVTVYEDTFRKFADMFQGAIDDLYSEKVTDLDSSMMKALIEKIGTRASKEQHLITKSAGFQSFEDQVYGNYGMTQGFNDANTSLKLAEIKGTDVHLYNIDGAEFIKKFQNLDPEKTGYYLDPPYFKSAQVYKEKAEGTELDKFASPWSYFQSHLPVFEAQKKGAKLALTNDVFEGYFSLMEKNIEGANIFAYKEGTTPTSLIADSKTSENIHSFFDRMEEIRREYRGKREMINSLIETGELTRTVLQEAKKEVGLKRPISMATEKQLDDIIAQVEKRIKFKEKRGFTIGERKDIEITKEDYNKVGGKPPVKIRDRVNFKISAKSMDKYLGVISTRLKTIDPSLKRAIRRLESGILITNQKDLVGAKPWIDKTKKMDTRDFRVYDYALKNGDIKKINEINKKYGITDEYNNVRTLLDGIYRRAKEVNFDIEYRKNYMPRSIKNAQDFVEYFSNQENFGIIEKSIRQKEMAIGRTLSLSERAYLINAMIRGYSGNNITLSEAGSMKHRKIEKITPEINDLYNNSVSSLARYITDVNEKIESRKFFGKQLDVNEANENLSHLESSIGAYTAKLVRNETISIKQEIELREILQARFNPKGTHGLVGIFKNITYATVLGSPYNAITQLGDMAFAQYQSGFFRGTLKGLKSMAGMNELKKEDLGIDRIAYELTTEGMSAKFTNFILKAVGLETIDRFGKEALINGVISKYQEMSKNPTKAFKQDLREIFGDEVKGSTVEDILGDLQAGDITENVKYLALNKLLDMQPLTLSEVPEGYLRGGNSRVFYMLKTWTLKKFDVYRSEIVMLAKTNPKQAAINFVRLTVFLMLMDAGADEIKDWMLGRKKDFSDKVVDQILKICGFSRYSLYTTEREGIGSTIMEQIVPPTRAFDNVSRDVINLFKDFDESAHINELRSIQEIPVGGKLYYWWFGKGAEYRERDKGEAGGVLKSNIKSIKKSSIQSSNIKKIQGSHIK